MKITKLSLEEYKIKFSYFEKNNLSVYNTPDFIEYFILISKLNLSENILLEDNGNEYLITFIVEHIGHKTGKKYLVSLFNGCYGSFIPINKENNNLNIDFELLKKKLNAQRLLIIESPLNKNKFFGELKKKYNETHILDLSIGYSEIYNNYKESLKRALRKANRCEIVVEEASIEKIKEFISLYRKTEQRWEKNNIKYSVVSDNNFYNLKLLSKYLKLFFVKSKEKEVIAGIVLLEYKNNIIYWYGAVNENGLKFRAMDFLMDFVIQYAEKKNVKNFNLGGSQGLEGLRQYKKKFGSKEVLYPYYIVE